MPKTKKSETMTKMFDTTVKTKVKADKLPKKTVDYKYIVDNFKDSKVLEFGRGLQANIANFTGQILEKTKATELIDSAKAIKSLQKTMRESERIRQGKTGIIHRIKNLITDKVEDIRSFTDTAKDVIDKVDEKLSQHQTVLIEDAQNYEKLQILSDEYSHALNTSIQDGENRIEDAKKFMKKFSKDKTKQKEVKQAYNYINAFEKRIVDLKITQGILATQCTSLEFAKQANIKQHQTINTIRNNTIPMLEQQMVQSLLLAHTDAAAENARLVVDTTNQMMRDNATYSKDIAKKIAIENERPIVDIATIEHMNKKLIETHNDLKKIAEEGKANRKHIIERLNRTMKDTRRMLISNMESELGEKLNIEDAEIVE